MPIVLFLVYKNVRVFYVISTKSERPLVFQLGRKEPPFLDEFVIVVMWTFIM